MKPAKIAALAVAVTFTFYAFWWNRFVGGTGVDGVFHLVALHIVDGRMPYRDVTLLVPPLDAITAAALIKTFGNQMISARILGLFTRLLLAAIVFLWLSRLLRPWPALTGTLIGVIVFSSAPADPLAGYNHNASFWAVLAGYCASRALDARRPAWAAFAGCFAAFSFLTKQTTGLGATLAIFLVIAVACRISRPLFAYLAGWAVPAGAVVLWLSAGGALQAFIEQLFIKGPGSKGSAIQILGRPILVTLGDAWLRQEALLAVLALIVLAWAGRRYSASTTTEAPRALWLTAAGAVLCLVAALWASNTALAAHPRVVTPQRVVMFLSLYGSAVAWIYFGLRREYQLWLIASVSLAVAYMHSLSFVVTESMSLPSLAFLIALLLHRLPATLPGQALRWATVAACAGTIFTAATYKLGKPFGWYGWEEPPVSASQQRSTLPQFAGLRMSAPSAEFFERLVKAVDANSQPQDRILAFFYLPLAHILTGRFPATSTFNHFIDVAPDEVCRADAARLEANPPPVIVYTPLSPGEIDAWEHDFRAGRPSGQRDLVATLDKLLLSRYRLVESLNMPGTNRPVRVYAIQ